MADNVTLPGTGVVVDAEDIGAGVERQRVRSIPDVVSSASLTSLASSTSSAQLLASTATRKGLILHNTDAYDVYVKYGATASATSYTVMIAPNGYWEMPQPVYTGRIDAIWAGNGSGSLYATEL